jgi:hypothetical protein
VESAELPVDVRNLVEEAGGTDRFFTWPRGL